MCGFVGIICYRNSDRYLAKLPDMAGKIRYRGPDDEGFALFSNSTEDFAVYNGQDSIKTKNKEHHHPYIATERFNHPQNKMSVALAHRRLSIIDLSIAGHQPMCDETKRFWIVYNGEVYNFKEIRHELEALGYSFQSNTDTEVILKSYMAWGDKCQKRFNGMWAVLIWDNLKKTLWISRDRFGVKPLYYMLNSEFAIFCSEIKCMMPIVDLAYHMQEIYCYLADGPSEGHDQTLFKNVFRFPAAHCASIDAHSPVDSMRFNKYFELDFPNLSNEFSENRLRDYADEYYHLLKDAVRLRLQSDVELSCALSGGLDSSSITYLADEILKKDQKSSTVTAVSNVFLKSNTKYCDESHFIDLMVDRLSIKSLRQEPDGSNMLDQNDSGLWHYENCYDDLLIASVNTYEICKKNGIKVNLDGQGADEILAGYHRYWTDYFANQSLLNKEFWTSFNKVPISVSDKIKYFFRIPINNDNRHFLNSKIKKKLSSQYRKSRFISKSYTGDPVNLTLYNNVNFALKKLLRNVDFASMFHSIESRQPFLDYRLIGFLNSVPSTYKLRNGWTKYLARIAFENKIPSEIVWRKDKMGWPQPLEIWLKDNIQQVEKTLQNSEFIQTIIGKLSPVEIDKFKGNRRLLLRVYNLIRHHHLFIENEYSPHLPILN